MYIYKRSVGAINETLSNLQIVDLKDNIMKDTIPLYDQLIIVVEETIYSKEVSIDLMLYKVELYEYDGTIQQWLDTKANVSLTTSNKLPASTYTYAKYKDLLMEGFVPYPGDVNWSLTKQSFLTTSGAPDIRLSKNDVVDYHLMAKSCLFTFNGHFIRSIGTNEGIYLIGAGKNYRVNDDCGFGCISLANLSELTTDLIKEEMISIEKDEFGYSFRITFSKPINDKTLWLVLGGKLLVDKGIIHKVNDYEIRLSIRDLTSFYDVFESAKYIDLTSVEGVSKGVISNKEDALLTLYKQLLLNQNSFSILIENPSIGLHIEPLRRLEFPLTFISYDKEQHPLMLSNGMFPTYRTRLGTKFTMLDTHIQYSPHFISKTNGSRYDTYLSTNKIDNGNPRSLLQGYSFKIYTLLRKGYD